MNSEVKIGPNETSFGVYTSYLSVFACKKRKNEKIFTVWILFNRNDFGHLSISDKINCRTGEAIYTNYTYNTLKAR